MASGGYRVINLKGANLSISNAVTIDGIYSRIESTFDKPMLIKNFQWSGTEKRAVFSPVSVRGSDFEIPFSLFANGAADFIQIKQDDTVTIVHYAPSSTQSLNAGLDGESSASM